MDIDPQTVKQTAPGIIGAIGAAVFMRDKPWVAIGLIPVGAAFAYYGAPYMAKKYELPEGLVGFMIGLLGMIVIAKVLRTWEDLELGPIVQGALKSLLKRFGLGGDA